MKNLNELWLSLVILAVILLVVYFGWTIFESLSGVNSDFDEKITQFNSTELLPQDLMDHITESGSTNNNYGY